MGERALAPRRRRISCAGESLGRRAVVERPGERRGKANRQQGLCHRAERAGPRDHLE